ncbi:MAG: 2Fe-2S iron-sulfur cluster-binding protein [Deltaproteobacteria bacterium]|nr:2Fe-2S iron-sulfur cluster-binding protein [Deltaproteobacteria bacterium]
MNVVIDGQQIKCKKGDILLRVAITNGIYIPNLCFLEEREEPYAGCRLCFVEIEGDELPKCACTIHVEDGIKVNTRGEKALRLQKTAFELIMSTHPVDCKNCGKNGICELQRIAKHLKISLKTNKYQKFLSDLPVDDSSPVFAFDPNKCVQCGRCVYLSERDGLNCISFAYRGLKRRVSAFMDAPLGTTRCSEKKELVHICPVGAFVFKDRKNK